MQGMRRQVVVEQCQPKAACMRFAQAARSHEAPSKPSKHEHVPVLRWHTPRPAHSLCVCMTVWSWPQDSAEGHVRMLQS